jgi:hypothetical protein
VFSTAFELRGADLPFFSWEKKNGFVFGFFLLNMLKMFYYLVLKFDGLYSRCIFMSHFEALRGG